MKNKIQNGCFSKSPILNFFSQIGPWIAKGIDVTCESENFVVDLVIDIF